MFSTVQSNRQDRCAPHPDTIRRLRAFWLASVLLLGPVFADTGPAQAQEALAAPEQGEDARMLVEADEMIYDYDRERVSAVGNVQIYYGDHTIEADKVVYDQASARLIAEGNVRINQPNGDIITANFADITDDFRTGFVRSLRLQTPQRARFAAEKAERQDDDITIFDKGVYTTCEPCRDNPKKSPLWQIKAARIVYNNKDKMVYYKSAKFEFLGIPLLYTPYLAHPEPARKRSTGFLTPGFGYDEALGYQINAPYYWALEDNYDVTFTPTYYSNQGLLASVEWRHRLNKGQYSITASGIFQQGSEEFAGTSGEEDRRGAIESTGEFDLSKQWKFGWDVALLSDRRFMRDYKLTSQSEDKPLTLYLQGLGERNYFDARTNYYKIMTDELSQGQQAVILPSVDYSAYSKTALLGGEGRLQVNSTNISREEENAKTAGGIERTFGLEGSYNRTSVEASWKRRFVTNGGQVITPFTSLRGDFFWLPSTSGAPAALLNEDFAFRGMPTVGLDYRMPILATSGTTSHIIEPVAQLIVRPNETRIGQLPNDDAQSLIFDDTILFDPNKFSGYDRVEGGTRANIGFQYRMQMASGWSLNALAGRSYHLGGTNSFSKQDLTSTGLDSGLDSKKSDYVARVGLNSNKSFRAIGRARLSSSSGDLKYASLEATGSRGRFTGTVGYQFADKRPSAGVDTARHELTNSLDVKLTDYWTASGSTVYDLENSGLVNASLGLKYDDECFAISLNYSHVRDVYTDSVSSQSVRFNIDFKSLGSTSYNHTFDNSSD